MEGVDIQRWVIGLLPLPLVPVQCRWKHKFQRRKERGKRRPRDGFVIVRSAGARLDELQVRTFFLVSRKLLDNSRSENSIQTPTCVASVYMRYVLQTVIFFGRASFPLRSRREAMDCHGPTGAELI
jgi:hypothetical protein